MTEATTESLFVIIIVLLIMFVASALSLALALKLIHKVDYQIISIIKIQYKLFTKK